MGATSSTITGLLIIVAAIYKIGQDERKPWYQLCTYDPIQHTVDQRDSISLSWHPISLQYQIIIINVTYDPDNNHRPWGNIPPSCKHQNFVDRSPRVHERQMTAYPWPQRRGLWQAHSELALQRPLELQLSRAGKQVLQVGALYVVGRRQES